MNKVRIWCVFETKYAVESVDLAARFRLHLDERLVERGIAEVPPPPPPLPPLVLPKATKMGKRR